jgi:hypothetical protein
VISPRWLVASLLAIALLNFNTELRNRKGSALAENNGAGNGADASRPIVAHPMLNARARPAHARGGRAPQLRSSG